MKHVKSVSLVLLLIVGIGLVAFTMYYLANRYLGAKNEQTSTPTCDSVLRSHEVTIQNDHTSTGHITGQLCDTMTITNKDSTKRLISFGTHDRHEAYDEITERLIGKDESFTITLNQTGNFLFHDHMNEKVKTTFTVTE